MGIYVKGMGMPKNCAECPVALSGKYCRISQTYTTYIKLPIRPGHCPLVEVPEPHGRLIDADELAETAEFYETVMDIGHHAQTVIEAERER